MKPTIILFTALFTASLPEMLPAAGGPLRAGAARVDITPAPDAALPMAGYASRTQGFKAIHDHVYVRAIVLDDGTTQVAIAAWESLFVPDQVWSDTSQRISRDLGIRPENLILAAVHDHGAPTLARGLPSGSRQDSADTVAYTRFVEEHTVEAIRRAKQQLQPARFGIGSGAAHLNVNRRELSPRGWGLGYNENGPSDKTVTVLRFEDLGGKPIAFLINYGVHSVVMGPNNYQVTGDLAGATSRFVETHYLGGDQPRSDGGPRVALRAPERTTGDGAVAIWTSGAAGDQNPVSMASGEDFTMVDAFGKVLGEEAIRVAASIKTSPEARLWGAQQVATCPGRRLEPAPTPRTDYKFTDAGPVNIRLSLLMLGEVALTGVSGEVFTLIGQRLQKESPWNHTVMITHANGSSGYIPNDAAFDQISYEITTSQLKPGCAEGAIVNGFLDLMRSH
jgi:hypothetical protein